MRPGAPARRGEAGGAASRSQTAAVWWPDPGARCKIAARQVVRWVPGGSRSSSRRRPPCGPVRGAVGSANRIPRPARGMVRRGKGRGEPPGGSRSHSRPDPPDGPVRRAARDVRRSRCRRGRSGGLRSCERWGSWHGRTAPSLGWPGTASGAERGARRTMRGRPRGGAGGRLGLRRRHPAPRCVTCSRAVPVVTNRPARRRPAAPTHRLAPAAGFPSGSTP